jgi:hypothetical protein
MNDKNDGGTRGSTYWTNQTAYNLPTPLVAIVDLLKE